METNNPLNTKFNEPNIFPKNNFFDESSNNFDKITDAKLIEPTNENFNKNNYGINK